MPEHCPELTLAVNDSKRGPLRIALAHENQHLDEPTLSCAEDSKQWGGEFALPTPTSNPGTPRSPNKYVGVRELNLKPGVTVPFKVPKL